MHGMGIPESPYESCVICTSDFRDIYIQKSGILQFCYYHIIFFNSSTLKIKNIYKYLLFQVVQKSFLISQMLVCNELTINKFFDSEIPNVRENLA